MEPASTVSPSPIPTDYGDIAFTRAVLDEMEAHLRALDKEVVELQDRLGSLEQQKKLLQRQIDIRDSLCAPVNRLPPSLLGMIFRCCLPFGRNSAMSNKEAPVSLGQVCSRWRQLTFNMPELWASIHIPLVTTRPSRWSAYINRKHQVVRLEAITSWLSRSAMHPLSISLAAGGVLPPTVSPFVEEMVSPYLELLSSYSTRWKIIYIQLHGLDWIQHFFSRYKVSDLPLLEKLHIDGSRCNIGKFTSAAATKALSAEDSFLRCPNLNYLSLPLLGELIVGVPVKWSQLTVLNLNGACSCPLFQIMETLSLCPNLECLSTCFDISSSLADLSLEQTVTLPRLRNLCVIDHCTSFDSPRFFNHLSAPNIRSLAYDRYAPSPWLSHLITRESLSPKLFRALGSFISRAQQPVEELSLQYDWLLEVDLFRFLSILPDLKRLSLRGSGPSIPSPRYLEPMSKRLVLDNSIIQELLTVPNKNDIVITTRGVCDHESESDSDSDGEGSTGGSSDHPALRPIGVTRLSDSCEGGEVWQETYNFFCPKLEVLHCTGATFSGQSLLNFLRSRATSSKRFGISRIHIVDIAFALGVVVPPQYVLDEIDSLSAESGMRLFLDFLTSEPESTPLSDPYSPLDGVHAVGFRSSSSAVFNPVF